MLKRRIQSGEGNVHGITVPIPIVSISNRIPYSRDAVSGDRNIKYLHFEFFVLCLWVFQFEFVIPFMVLMCGFLLFRLKTETERLSKHRALLKIDNGPSQKKKQGEEWFTKYVLLYGTGALMAVDSRIRSFRYVMLCGVVDE